MSTQGNAVAAPPAKAPPKPKSRWIPRWGNIIFLLVVVAAFLFAGVAPTAKWGLEKYGSLANGAPVKVEKVSFNPMTFTLTLVNLAVADAKSKKSETSGSGVPPETTYAWQLFSADEVVCAVDLPATLRGQIVFNEVRVTGGKGKAVREIDGSINVGGPEATPPPPAGTSESAWKKKLEEQAKSRDIVKDFQDLLKRIQERRKSAAEAGRQAAEKRRQEGIGDPDAKADWVWEDRPLLVVRQIIADNMTFEIEDKAAGTQPPPIQNAAVHIYNLTSSPLEQADAITVTARFDAPAAAFDPLVKNTIPIVFGAKTKTTVDSTLVFERGWTIDWRPKLKLADIEAKARDASSTILGIDAQKFADALTEVKNVDLDDVHIFGEVWNPTVDTGQTLKNVVITALRKKGEAAAADALGKLTDKIDPNLKKKIEESPAGDAIQKAKDAAGDKIKGLFGGN